MTAVEELASLGPCDLDWRVGNPRNGYVARRVNGRRVYVHRYAMEQHLGRDLDPEEQVGHHCHDLAARAGLCQGGSDCEHRRCKNPEHLVIQTAQENLSASPLTIANQRRSQSHCKWGHPFRGDNLVIRNGRRRCRICLRRIQREADIRRGRRRAA